MLDRLLIDWVTKTKPGSNSVEDHPQLSHNRHPVDGALVGADSLWPEQDQICDAFPLIKYIVKNSKFVCNKSEKNQSFISDHNYQYVHHACLP